MQLKVKKLSVGAKIPSYATHDDAAMDLYSTEPVSVLPGEIKMIPTGIAMEIPGGHVGLIWDKSGLAVKFGLKVMGGVIDSGYRGEIMIGMTNLSDKEYHFEKGDKVAQMVIQEKKTPEVVEADELSETERGEGAFGSTGKK